jgi:hypothetical protein
MIGSIVFIFSDEDKMHLYLPVMFGRQHDIQYNDTQLDDIQQNLIVLL